MAEVQDLIEHLGDTAWKLSTLIKDRFTTNFSQSFTSMTPKQWLRLVVIVCFYLLLRPHVLKMGARHQQKQMEKQQKEDEEKEAQISPNQLRGQVDIPGESDDDEQAETTSSEWGKKARKRQRNVIKKLLEAEEKRLEELQEDEEDKDIDEYLVG